MTEPIRGEVGTESDSYREAMDRAAREKWEQIKEAFVGWEKDKPIRVLSVGAGGGGLERILSEEYPNAKIVAVDASYLMLESLDNGDWDRLGGGVESRRIRPVQARAQELPFRAEEFDLVIMSSVGHEISSYAKDENQQYSLEAVRPVIQRVAMALKPGGRLVYRDFVEAEGRQGVWMEFGGEKTGTNEMSPVEFAERYVNDFKGSEMGYLQAQMARLKRAGMVRGGMRLWVRTKDWVDMVVHASWGMRKKKAYELEVKEKHSLATREVMGRFLQECFTRAGVGSKLMVEESFLSSGYEKNLRGAIKCMDETGEKLDLPKLMGVWVVEKDSGRSNS